MVALPQRSPDTTLLDFSLWNYMKSFNDNLRNIGGVSCRSSRKYSSRCNEGSRKSTSFLTCPVIYFEDVPDLH